MDTEPSSDRVRVRRHSERGSYSPDDACAVLDEAMIAHVGVITADGPVVLPMAFGRDGSTLYLHGAVGNALLRGADSAEVCVTVTLLDGLVLARSAYHHSMNYRSVVVRGTGRRVTDEDEIRTALRAVTDHIVQRWDDSRAVDASEVRATLVLAVPLEEVSVKSRSGDPVDEASDLAGPFWAGVVPVSTTLGDPLPAANLDDGIAVPAALSR